MSTWLRLFVLLFFILTVAYVLLWFRAQMRERSRLKAEHAKTNNPMDERDYVNTELEKYNRGLKPKLLLVVYLFPILVAAFLMYLANS